MKLMKHPLHGWHHAMDNADETRMVAAGWVDASAAPQVAPQVAPPAAPQPVAFEHIDVLRARARAAGIKVDGRWGESRLIEELDALTGPLA